jgi:hypothetical protein
MTDTDFVYFDVVGDRSRQLLFEKFGKRIDYHKDILQTHRHDFYMMQEFMLLNNLAENLVEMTSEGTPLTEAVKLELDEFPKLVEEA